MKTEVWSAGEGESNFQGPGGIVTWENLFAEGTHERDKQL